MSTMTSIKMGVDVDETGSDVPTPALPAAATALATNGIRSAGEESSTTPDAVPTARRQARKHVKSRTGCGTCKKRKIKCDESRPACRNCVRYSTQCDFVKPPTPPPPPVPPRMASASPTPSGDLNLLDLELLHNFTTSTYTTLSLNPVVRETFRIGLVRMAFDCGVRGAAVHGLPDERRGLFLIRTILAVSALHLAHHRPDRAQAYQNAAIDYHQRATREAVSMMADVNESNWERLFAFGLLTLYYALGSPRHTRAGSDLLDDFPFKHRNGLLSIFFSRPFHNETPYIGPLQALTRRGTRDYKLMLARAQEHPELLRDLQHLVHEAIADERISSPAPAALSSPHPTSRGAVPDEAEEQDRTRRKAVYDDAILKLRGCLAVALSGEIETDSHFAMLWMFVVEPEFLELLRPGPRGEAPHQEAVAIFAHFCVLLHRIRYDWWLTGWDVYLLAKAWHLLDQSHRLWIQWPISECGWVPPYQLVG